MSSESDETSVLSDQVGIGDDIVAQTESDNDWLSKLTESCGKQKDYEDGDIYSDLEQKEQDLRLAAELGKILVQENEDLKQVNRQQMESFSQKIEDLNQENYRLKLRLDAVTAEYQLAKSEHQSDIDSLKQELADVRKRSQSREIADRDSIDDLTRQNEKLTEQLLNDTLTEKRVQAQVDALRLSVCVATELDTTHQEQLDALSTEMTEMKAEMDVRLVLKKEECDKLALSLEGANERVLYLEKERAVDTEKIQYLEEELRKQEDINMQLLLKLENLSMSSSSTSSMMSPVTLTQETSLFAELELLSHSMSVNSFDNRPTGKITIGTQLKQEILEVFRQLQRLKLEVQGRADEWSPEFVEISDLRAGQLLTMLTDLRSLVHERLRPASSNSLNTEKSPRVEGLLRQISNLQGQLSASQSRANSLESELGQRDRQLLRKCDELKQLEMQFQVNRIELTKMRKNYDLVLDKSAGIHSADEVLLGARSERDEALKSNADLVSQVAKLRLDLAALDRQLLDAVSQKLLLSQQLEAWQSDMQDLIDTKMADEIARDKRKHCNGTIPAAPLKDRTAAKPSVTVSSPVSKSRFSLRWT